MQYIEYHYHNEDTDEEALCHVYYRQTHKATRATWGYYGGSPAEPAEYVIEKVVVVSHSRYDVTGFASEIENYINDSESEYQEVMTRIDADYNDDRGYSTDYDRY